jgi:cytochrome c oxidase subunit 2
MRTKAPSAALILLAAITVGCSGVQSALAPAGREAEDVARLWWAMAAGALAVWVAVVLLGIHYGRPHDASINRARDRWLIIGGGVVVPVLVLTGLLAYGLSMIPPLVARAPQGSLLVEVEGELWWWRIRYPRPDGSTVELANEIRLPVGEPVQFRLSSDNVIHSFWVPPLGGKIDLIPGRTTYLALHPTRTGVVSGACAEYCGTAHGFMRLFVEVMDRPAFDAWLDGQSAPAAAPSTAEAERGARLVLQNGCGACHAIRGTAARGRLAPDLTHVASRMSLAAGTLPTTRAAFGRWLAAPERLKPGAHMPAFAMLGTEDVRAMAAYLEGLQ